MLKRVFTGLFVLLILALAAVYFLIPGRIFINNNIIVTTTDAHVFQFLNHQKEWKKWWPGTSATDFQYQYHNSLYTIKKLTNEDVVITVASPELALNTQLSFITTDANRVKLNWSSVKVTGLNPIDRFKSYLQVTRIKKNMDQILQHFKLFLEDDRNIYQITARITKVKTPVILATKTVMQHYPEMTKVYKLIGEIEQQIRQQQATETGPPMLNVHQTDLNNYEVMVGIPITKVIKPAKNMLINKMVLGGNILETDVKGGLNAVRNASTQLEKYKKDHNLVSPAMPYEALITNRLAESDTTKWLTKIYYPIF